MMPDYAQLWRLMLPEVVVVVTAIVALGADLLVLRKMKMSARFGCAAVIGSVGCAAAIAMLWVHPAAGSVMGGVLLANPLTALMQSLALVFAILTLLIAADSDFTEHVGEFVLLVLLATVGMMFLVATRDLLVLFVALELLSLPLYVLTGFDKRSRESSEAALKYFLFGGMSAAFLLFGFSLLYGVAGSTNLARVGEAVGAMWPNPLIAVALVMTVVGLGFKVAAAPFHFWAPDVYEGAPAASAGFIASGSKVASFFIFFELMVVGFAGAEGGAAWMHWRTGWVPVVAVVAAVSMVLGSLVAIVQSNVRRLLAYSAIAHAGYMLLAFVAHTDESLAALIYYVATYAVATIGAFAVVGVVERAGRGGSELRDFDGLARRAPGTAFCLMIFMLSLAGIPPLAGFFGKFYLFIAVLRAGMGGVWLVGLALAMTAVSFYYYLQVLKRAFVTPGEGERGRVEVGGMTGAAVVVMAAVVVGAGVLPTDSYALDYGRNCLLWPVVD